MTKMPLKGIRARLTRHGQTISGLRTQLAILTDRQAEISAKIGEILAYLRR